MEYLSRLMSTRQLNYAQANAWIKLKLQIWLLQGAVLTRKIQLPLDILLHISTD